MVAHLSVEDEDLHIDTLPPKTRKAFLAASSLPIFFKHDWYLAGGTALALQSRHRQSVDLDFFTPRPKFPELAWQRSLTNTGKWKTTIRQEGTLYGTFLSAKMSFIAYPFFIPSGKYLQYGNLRILPIDDIAAMKIIAISHRGRKRDFIDLYWYCQNREPLESTIHRTLRHYPKETNNLPHILKSLAYFADAEEDLMPKIFFRATWKEVKAFFQKEVPRITKKFVGLE